MNSQAMIDGAAGDGAARRGEERAAKSRFTDTETGGTIRLELLSIDGHEFALLRRISYDAPGYGEPFTVPEDIAHFRTDLASVPAVFTWLVPRSGIFLPAAVLHDGLVREGAYLGPQIDRVEADRIFRDAMAYLGTGTVRAWLMWAAVTMATMWEMPARRWYWRAVLVGLLGAVAAVGVLATLDLLGVWDVVPWMPEASIGLELIGGAAGALVIPSLLALTWGRFARAGIIVGVALAFLLHVTAVIVVIYGLYWVLERLVSGRPTQGVYTNATRQAGKPRNFSR